MIKRFLKQFLFVKPEPIPMRHTKEEIRSTALAYAQQIGGRLTDPIGVVVWPDTKGWIEGPDRGPVWHVCDAANCLGGNWHMLIDDETKTVLKDWVTPM